MKLNFFVLLSAALLGTNGYAQTGGGAAAGGSASGGTATGAAGANVSANGTVGAAGAGVSTTTSTSTSGGAGVRVTPQPLLPGSGNASPRPQTPLPNPPQQGQVPPQQNAVSQNGNQLSVSNGVSIPSGMETNQLSLNATNQAGANQGGVGATNQFGGEANLAPTSQPGLTNRVMATNNPASLTNNSRLMRDQALSEGDRRLLAQIQTAVFGSSGAPAPLGGTAVHFILRDGAVRIVGFVPTAEEQKRIENIVQQVPGVVRVYDALQIGVSAVPGQSQ